LFREVAVVFSRSLTSLLPLLVLPFLAACSDQRATFEIKGSSNALSLIRVTSFPWDKTAKYSIVAARMPDCMRRHSLPEAPLDARVEVFSPGNEAWIIRQNGRMFVTETRTCEGFASLDKEPEGGIGPLAGAFEMRSDTLVFIAAPKAVAPATEPVPAAPLEPVLPAAPSSSAARN
jgi:hypothetical protein